MEEEGFFPSVYDVTISIYDVLISIYDVNNWLIC